MLEERLLEYQIEPAHALRQIVAERRQAGDLSDTGLGKTYVAMAVLQTLKRPVLVACPAAVRPIWRRVAEHFGVELVSPQTYNILRTGRTPWFQKFPGPPPGTRYKQSAHFRYTGPNESIVVFDEAHNCGGRGTQNAELMIACKRQNVRSIALSATLAETPLQMRAPGYFFGLHSLADYWKWAQRQGVVLTQNMGPQWYAGKERRLEIMSNLQSQLVPARAIRLRQVDLAHLFPENIVTADAYEMETAGIRRAYEEMHRELEIVRAVRLQDKERDAERRAEYDELHAKWEMDKQQADSMGSHFNLPEPKWRTALPAVASARFRQEIELLKVPTFLELAQDAIAEGNRVVLFVNFSATIEAIRAKADGFSVVEGGQTEVFRQEQIDAFNRGDVNLAVVQSDAGGTGTSFHDTVGDSPRVAIISPMYSAKVLKQVLGRCPRAGGKTPVVQKIVYAADTPEEEACKAVRGKLGCLAALNDGDLAAGLPFDL